jgi:cyclohexanone monooxygenase
MTSEGNSVDVLVVGAGFSGLYLLHRLRALGLRVQVVEAGSDVGGTWYWNRYPGARCDVESMQYSYSFDEALQQEWVWPERFSAQPDILKYANHVAERFDLRRDIAFNTRVAAAHLDEASGLWKVTTERGDMLQARYFIMATGCLSSARLPDIEGLDSFDGRVLHTGQWPHEPVDLSDQRVAVIGTGSSAIQAIPVIAEQAAHLTVFQRTPNYSIPSRNQPMSDDYSTSWKTDYASHREQARHSRNGILQNLNDQSALDVDEAERAAIYEQRWKDGGTYFVAAFNDLAVNQSSNDTAAQFVRAKIRETVKDPQVAEMLCPYDYPIGTKRICVDTHYFETFNRDNVTLVDIRKTPISRVDTAGVVTGEERYEVDALVVATGFDAMTGAMTAVDIKGRDDRRLAQEWADGPQTYLGLMCEGFPNLFMVTGPGSPSVLSNMIVSIEQHVDWITDCIAHLQSSNQTTLEPTRQAQDAWVAHVNEVAHKTLYPNAASWYMGANIPGKPRIFMPYIGGVGAYRKICDDIVEEGYRGFKFEAVANESA